MDEMEIIYFENLPSTKTPISAANLNKIQTNAQKAIKNKKAALELLTVSIVAPTECKAGDKYYNTIDKKIYTATEDNIWGTDGTEPLQEYLYIDLGNKNLYYYDGTNFNSYGGGSGGGDTLPIGTIVPYGSDVVPDNYLLANGQLVSRTDYSELFNIIGTTYGEGDGSTTFALPDYRGRVPVGKDSDDTDFDTLGNTGGGTAKDKIKVAGSNYGLTDITIVTGTGYGGQGLVSVTKNTSENAQSLEDNGIDFMPPYVVTNFIIKAKMTVAIEGEIIQEDGTASETNVYSSVAMDNKIQSLKRVTLYENASGTNTTLTLNDSVANYEDIEIFYKSNDNAYSSVKVNNANNKNIVLINMTPNTTNNVLYVKATVVKAQNNSITVVDGLEGYGSGGITTGNKNYILKVVGYKEV